MITKYLLPIIKNEDKSLPLYVVTAEHYTQDKVIRPYGIPHYQLLMTLEGSGIVHLGKKKYTLSRNNILFLTPGTPQSYMPSKNWTTLYITYALNWSSNYFLLKDDVIFPKDPELYIELASRIVDLNTEPDFCRKTSPLLYELLLTLQSEVSLPNNVNNHLNDIHLYIKNHFYEEVELKTMSDMCGLSPEYFSILYKKNYNMSPFEHIHKLRIQMAKEMLINTKYSISEICLAVGYKDPSHFTKQFRLQESLTPKKFREIYKNKYKM